MHAQSLGWPHGFNQRLWCLVKGVYTYLEQRIEGRRAYCTRLINHGGSPEDLIKDVWFLVKVFIRIWSGGLRGEEDREALLTTTYSK